MQSPVKSLPVLASDVSTVERSRLGVLFKKNDVPRNGTGRAPSPPSPAPSLTVVKADDILETAWPEPNWAIPGLLSVGLALLGGRPKAGKSWLALQIAQAVGAGGMALGKKVEPGPVLYLALEDTPRRLQERMRRQNWPKGLPVCFLHLGDRKQIGNLKKEGTRKIEATIREHGFRLTIIDTLSRAIRGLDRKDPNVLADILEPLFEAAHATNSAVMVIDHLRKPGMVSARDVVDDLVDSTVKTATPDTLWGLYRDRGKPGAKLQITGKDIEEATLQLEFDPLTGCWQCKGDGGTVLTGVQNQLVDAVRQLGGHAPLGRIAAKAGKDMSNARRVLMELVECGVLTIDAATKEYRIVDARLPSSGGSLMRVQIQPEREKERF